jgi:hypothetical protein
MKRKLDHKNKDQSFKEQVFSANKTVLSQSREVTASVMVHEGTNWDNAKALLFLESVPEILTDSNVVGDIAGILLCF